MNKIFVFFPLGSNCFLAFAAFALKPGDFHDGVWLRYVTIAAALVGAGVSLLGFRVHDLNRRQ